MTTLAEVITVYLQEDRAPLTNKEYRRVLQTLAQRLGGETEVQDISYLMLVSYLNGLRQRTSRTTGQPLQDSTLRHQVTVIRSLFNWCVTAKLLTESPAHNLTVRTRPKADKTKAIPPQELTAILDYARPHRRNYALLLFLADTGCRVGGLVSLQLSNLDLEARSARLLEKGGHWHTALFGEATAQALQHWLDKRPVADHDYVWTGPGPTYQPLKRNAVNVLLARLCESAGTSRSWSPHSIRHAVGHSLAKGGVPLTMIQRKLGHSDPSVTMRYYQPKDDAYLREISDRLALAALGTDKPTSATAPEEPDNNVIQRDDWQQWRKKS